MKTLKLAVLVLLVTLSSCCSDDDWIQPETIFKTITYDSQDNILKIDHTGDWLISMDWNTYEDEFDWESANPYFGVQHDWSYQGIQVKSDTYEIVGMKIEGIYVNWTIQEGVITIEVPSMQTYMDDTDIFEFQVEIIKPI